MIGHVNGVCDHGPMKDGSVLGTASVVAAVPFERIQPLLTSEDAPTLLDVEHRAAGLTVGAEPDDSLVWMHGGFWYQGEYQYAPCPTTRWSPTASGTFPADLTSLSDFGNGAGSRLNRQTSIGTPPRCHDGSEQPRHEAVTADEQLR